MSSPVVAIYVLIDPRSSTRRPMYAGQSDTPKKRLREHRAHARKVTDGVCRWNSRRDVWIRELDASGLRPLMVVLRQVPASESDAAEIQCIRVARAINPGLLNANTGGRRPKLRQETKEKIGAGNRGKTHTQEQNAGHSASLKGRKATPEEVEASRRGRLGKAHAPARCINIGTGKRGKKRGAGASKHVGLSRQASGAWKAQIDILGQRLHIGSFPTELDASIAYQWVLALVPEILTSTLDTTLAHATLLHRE